jgi:hypothetical protein
MSPELWNVPTIGPSKPIRVARLGPGTTGSCRCTTSGRMLRSAAMVRRVATGPGAIGATEPLLSHSTLGPIEITPGSGGGPSQGATTLASTPSARSARASPRT